MLPTCRQVAQQASENIDEPVKGMKLIKMKLHLLICKYCRLYQKQIKLSCETVKAMDDKAEINQELQKKIKESYKKTHCKEETKD